MRDTSILQAYADHCDRQDVTARPKMFVRFLDIWGDPKGEIGIAEPEDLYHTAFALLCPWAMIPTLGEAQLVLVVGRHLEVTKLKASSRGYFEPSWEVPFSMDDRGQLHFGEPMDAVAIPEVGRAVMSVKKARMEQRFWQWAYTFDDVVPVVAGLLEQGGIVPE